MANNSYHVTLAVEGDTGHGSRPDEIKRHAIYAAFDIINDLRALLPKTVSLTVEKISTEGKNSTNQFPRVCTLSFAIINADATTQKLVDDFITKLPQTNRI